MTLTISGIPSGLSTKLIDEYLDIKKHFAMNDWGPGQLKGGRFAEVVLRIYQHIQGKTVTPFGTDIPAAEKELCGILGDEVIRRRGLPACG